MSAWEIILKEIEDKVEEIDAEALERMADCLISIHDRIPPEELAREGFDIYDYAADHPDIAAKIIRAVADLEKAMKPKRAISAS